MLTVRTDVPCLGGPGAVRWRGWGDRVRLMLALKAAAALRVLLGDRRVAPVPRYSCLTAPPGDDCCCNDPSSADLCWAACTCACSSISWLICVMGLTGCTPEGNTQGQYRHWTRVRCSYWTPHSNMLYITTTSFKLCPKIHQIKSASSYLGVYYYLITRKRINFLFPILV